MAALLQGLEFNFYALKNGINGNKKQQKEDGHKLGKIEKTIYILVNLNKFVVLLGRCPCIIKQNLTLFTKLRRAEDQNIACYSKL
jgi:hypothetical protein